MAVWLSSKLAYKTHEFILQCRCMLKRGSQISPLVKSYKTNDTSVSNEVGISSVKPNNRFIFLVVPQRATFSIWNFSYPSSNADWVDA
jgi:hypothetical protein